jgi:hypothetical protein
LAEQDYKETIVRKGLPDRAARTGLSEGTTRIGLPGKGCYDRTARIRRTKA